MARNKYSKCNGGRNEIQISGAIYQTEIDYKMNLSNLIQSSRRHQAKPTRPDEEVKNPTREIERDKWVLLITMYTISNRE